MSDLTFAQQLQAYERWKQEAGNKSPEKYEEWLELITKAALWDAVNALWQDEDESSDSVLDFLDDATRA